MKANIFTTGGLKNIPLAATTSSFRHYDSCGPPQLRNFCDKMSERLAVLKTIYRQKIWLIMLLLSLATIAFNVLEANKENLPWGWLQRLPWISFGEASLVAVIVAFTYEWFVREEAKRKLEETLHDILEAKFAEHSDEITHKISEALILNPDVMRSVLRLDVLEDVLRTALEIRLGDPVFASEAYDSIFSRVLLYSQRISNYRYKITVTSIKDLTESEKIRNNYWNEYWELRYDAPLYKTQFSFICVHTIQEYNELLEEQSCEVPFCYPPKEEFREIGTSLFDVEYIKVDSLELNIRREVNNGKYIVVADHPDLEKMLGRLVTISYRYRVKAAKRSHYSWIDVTVPTRNVSIEFDARDSDIASVTSADLFVSSNKPIYRYFPSREAARRIEIELNGWVLPKSGVVLGWVLQAELTEEFERLMSGHDVRRTASHS